MAQQPAILSPKGLYTQPNRLLNVPDGALCQADNIVIAKDGTAEPRRGFETYGTGIGGSTDRVTRLTIFRNEALAVSSNEQMFRYFAGSTYSGTFAAPPQDNAAIRFTEASQNLYWTTSTGVYVLDAIDGTPRLAGMPRAPDIQATFNLGSPPATWMPNDTSVAYRALWAFKDANKNLTLGFPAQRFTVTNDTGTTGAPTVLVSIPDGLPTDAFLQVYRSPATVNAEIEPSDEMGLVYEAALPASLSVSAAPFHYSSVSLKTTVTLGAHSFTENQIIRVTGVPTNFEEGRYEIIDVTGTTITYAGGSSIAGTHSGTADTTIQPLDVAFYDITPDALRGAALYANPNQETILQANDRPPICRDIAYFKNSTWFANTVGKHRLTLTLVGTDAPSGVQPGDTLTIAGVVYTAGTSEDTFGGNTFKVFTAGTPSENVADTAASLCRVINQSFDNSRIYAYVVSGPDDAPGIMELEERGIGGLAFTVEASANPNAYSPILASGAPVSSDNAAAKNRLFYSKALQPEAVPLTNSFDIGRADKEILRAVPLRDSMFVFKEDGVWRVTGDGPETFTVTAFDPTIILVAPETAAPLANAVFCLTNQGVMAVSDTGGTVLSRPIEDQLLGLERAALLAGAFGVGYETERTYLLWTVEQVNDSFPTQAFSYNLFTKAWCRWDRPQLCAAIANTTDPETHNRLFVASTTDNVVSRERKDYADTDYSDEDYNVTIVSSTGTAVTVADASNILVGDKLFASEDLQSLVISVDYDTDVLTVADDLAWTAGDATGLRAIQSAVGFLPTTLGARLDVKHVSEALLFFRGSTVPAPGAALLFVTDVVSPSALLPALLPISLDGADELTVTGVNTIRTYVPKESQRCNQIAVAFAHGIAQSPYMLDGLGLVFTVDSTRTAR